MDRLQKNCVIVSAGLHGLLAGAFLFGTAFLSPSSKAPDMDVLTVIPDVLVDAPFSGGGNPNVKQPDAPPPQPRPQPQQPTPAPPPQPERRVQPEPIVSKQPETPEPSDEPDLDKSATSKRLPTVNPKMTVRKSGAQDKKAESTLTDQAAARRARDARRMAVAGALANIGDVASSSTSVEIPGPGGEAFASYSQVVKSVYTLAWIEPRDVQDDTATVKVSVTIRRNGSVEDARIIRSSGNATVDASVRRTLERVDYVAPFPAGAKDEKRTFTINFNLKAKRQLG